MILARLKGRNLFPANVHQLVVPEARQHPAHPDHQPKEYRQLGDKNKNMCHSLDKGLSWRVEILAEWKRPTTAKQYHHQRRASDHRRIFPHEKQSKAHRTVFGIVTGHQLGFRFRKVKGNQGESGSEKERRSRRTFLFFVLFVFFQKRNAPEDLEMGLNEIEK